MTESADPSQGQPAEEASSSGRDGTEPRPVRSWPLTWLTVIAAFLLAGAVISVLPLERGAASEPALGTLFLLALSVAAITTVALLLIVWRQLRLPVSIAALVVLFNVLVVGVKFVAAPAAVYEANTQRAFETFFPLDDLVGRQRQPPGCSASTQACCSSSSGRRAGVPAGSSGARPTRGRGVAGQ